MLAVKRLLLDCDVVTVWMIALITFSTGRLVLATITGNVSVLALFICVAGVASLAPLASLVPLA